jgi:hypothetical protein
MNETLVNRVSQSSLVNFDLEKLYPTHTIEVFDLKDYLFMGMVLKEGDFRKAMDTFDWVSMKDKVVLLHCSVDTILPSWAYMLVTTNLVHIAKDVYIGTIDQYLDYYYKLAIDAMDISTFTDQKVVVKGCSSKKVPMSAYGYLVYKLKPIVKSIMFGEACSNVPIFKVKIK